ncbi:hypothetical protein V6R21_32125 [Limibacter armeniacum]|uniref:hypothetical protein n=1 Tax=Limibacter armeniacum TaxID=466084 RepID=UPI002FE5197B
MLKINFERIPTRFLVKILKRQVKGDKVKELKVASIKGDKLKLKVRLFSQHLPSFEVPIRAYLGFRVVRLQLLDGHQNFITYIVSAIAPNKVKKVDKNTYDISIF